MGIFQSCCAEGTKNAQVVTEINNADSGDAVSSTQPSAEEGEEGDEALQSQGLQKILRRTASKNMGAEDIASELKRLRTAGSTSDFGSSSRKVGFFVDDAGALKQANGGVEADMSSTLSATCGASQEIESKRRLVRNRTFYIVNAAEDEDGEREDAMKRASTGAGGRRTSRTQAAMHVVQQASAKVDLLQQRRSRGTRGGSMGTQPTNGSLGENSFALTTTATSASTAVTDMGEEEIAEDAMDEEAEIAEIEAAKEEHKKEMLEVVAKLVDRDYDILPAEMLLAEVEKLIGQERFANEVLNSDLFERFARKLDFFYDVGISCSEQQDDWIELYNGEKGAQLITGLIDPDDSTVVHYAVRCEIPSSITNVLAVANEIHLMPKWNSLVVGEPLVIGRRTAHYFVLNYQMSALGGMYKVETLNEIRRFSDQAGGYMVEYVTSVAPDHPSYKEPKKGFKRMQTLLKNVFIACGPEHTVLLQRGKLKLPFSATKWVAKTIGGVAGKFIVGGLVANSAMAAKPGNDWEAPIKEDKYGLYYRLSELIAGEQSVKRDPKNSEDGKIAAYDVASFFNKRRFHRASTRQVRTVRVVT
jgi:hypothetical protein